ncbi:MAG: glutaredoxin family protein [Bryobacterales bacterium]|nr:glutaredoxin family protein [Bryobacterales bacterium]
MLRVTLYSRPGCRLCETARRELEAAVKHITVEEIDVDCDPQLRARYGYDVPVAVADGRELFRHRFDPACIETIRAS